MGALWEVLYWVTFFYLITLIVRVVLSLLQSFSPQWAPQGPVLVVAEAVYSLTDPPVRALGRVIPPLRIGGIALDLAFLVVMLVTVFLNNTFAVLRG
jgi:YggT family protein